MARTSSKEVEFEVEIYFLMDDALEMLPVIFSVL